MNLPLITLIFFLGIYVWYLHRERENAKLDYDLLNSMEEISSFLKKGDSFETAMNEISKGTDYASKIFRKMLEKVKEGYTLSEAFSYFEKRNASHVLNYLSKLASAYEESGIDISNQMDEIETRITDIKNIEKELYTETASPVMVLQFVAIFGAPILVIFVPAVLELSFYSYSYYFMGFVVAIYGCFDYIVYSDFKKTLFLLPVFISGYVFVVNTVAPYIANFFIGLF